MEYDLKILDSQPSIKQFTDISWFINDRITKDGLSYKDTQDLITMVSNLAREINDIIDKEVERELSWNQGG